MTKFYNATFKSLGAEEMCERKGYKFDYLLADDTIVTLAVYKNDTSVPGMAWCCIDPSVGQALCYGKTRAKAVEKAIDLRDKFTQLRNSDKWGELLELYAAYEANGGKCPKKTGKKAPKASAKQKKTECKKVAEAVASPETDGKLVKVEPPKTEIKVTRAAIVPTAEGVKAEVIDEHVETVEHPEVAETAAEVTLATMRERFADRPNVAVTQKREGAPIWVEGETKPLHDELVELGFRWARKRSAWYYRVA